MGDSFFQKSVVPGRIQWNMLIAHHPPCDYDHTFKICKIRICARCFGIFLGIIICFSLGKRIPGFSFDKLFWFSFLLPLPAVIDFTTHEIELWQSNNGYRLISGLILGIYIGICANVFLKRGLALLSVLPIIYLAVLEIGVAMILKCTGHLEALIERYEKSVRE